MHLNSRNEAADGGQKSGWLRYWPEAAIALLMGILLYVGASWQMFHTNSDAAKYECYAIAFWQGTSGLKALPSDQCAFVLGHDPSFASSAPTTEQIVQYLQRSGMPGWLTNLVAAQSPTEPFHALPHEYPLLNVFVFSLALIVPPFLSQVAYALWMILLAILVYFLLLRYRSRGAALACAIYFVAGGWGTLAGRYDIVPAAFVLFAFLCAVKQRWNWSFALLAVATLLKLYPVLLLLPFLLVQQRAVQGATWYAWRRWSPLALYVSLCAVFMGLSLFLSVEGTLAPFTYFVGRPIQVESLSSSFVWLIDKLRHSPEQFVHTFGSLNVISGTASRISPLGPIVEVAGLLYVLWLQWRNKIDLAGATLLVLLLILLTGKVFSPQYLIWVVPLLAYVGQADWRWLSVSGVLSLLTTMIYPVIYTKASLLQVARLPLFYPTVTIRNFLLLGIVIYMVIYYTFRSPTPKEPLPETEREPAKAGV